MDRLDAMETYVAVLEAGSLSAAARALGRSLTSVSRQISALEEALGLQLLHRTTRRLAATDAGRLYGERARRILVEVAGTAAALAAHTSDPAGELRLSAPTLLGRRRLAPQIPDYLLRYPGVTIDLMLVDRPVNLVEEGIDLAIVVGTPESSSMMTRKLGDVHMVVCGRPDYLDRAGEPETPNDLAGHDCVVFSSRPGPADWSFRRSTGERLAVRVSARLRANDLDALTAAALGGVGLVRVPLWLVAEHVVRGRLRRVLTAYERPPTPVHALFPPGRLLSPKVRTFLDFIVARWASADVDSA